MRVGDFSFRSKKDSLQSVVDIRELKLLAEFSHPNIVRFVSCSFIRGGILAYIEQRGICIPEDSTHVPCMLVSELCENGDLFDYIVSLINYQPSRFS